MATILRFETYSLCVCWTISVPAADRNLDHLLKRLITEKSVLKSYQKAEHPGETAFTASENLKGKFNRRVMSHDKTMQGAI